MHWSDLYPIFLSGASFRFGIKLTLVFVHHKLGSEHNFVAAGLSAELITCLNCDLTLIYLIRRLRRRRRGERETNKLPEIELKMAIACVFIALAAIIKIANLLPILQ